MFWKKKPKEITIEKVPLSDNDRIMVTFDNLKGGTYEDSLYGYLETIDHMMSIDMYEPPMLYWVGKAFLTGRGGVPIHHERGIYYINLASECGLAEAREIMQLIRTDRKAIEKITMGINSGKYLW